MVYITIVLAISRTLLTGYSESGGYAEHDPNTNACLAAHLDIVLELRKVTRHQNSMWRGVSACAGLEPLWKMWVCNGSLVAFMVYIPCRAYIHKYIYK